MRGCGPDRTWLQWFLEAYLSKDLLPDAVERRGLGDCCRFSGDAAKTRAANFINAIRPLTLKHDQIKSIPFEDGILVGDLGNLFTEVLSKVCGAALFPHRNTLAFMGNHFGFVVYGETISFCLGYVLTKQQQTIKGALAEIGIMASYDENTPNLTGTGIIVLRLPRHHRLDYSEKVKAKLDFDKLAQQARKVSWDGYQSLMQALEDSQNKALETLRRVATQTGHINSLGFRKTSDKIRIFSKNNQEVVDFAVNYLKNEFEYLSLTLVGYRTVPSALSQYVSSCFSCCDSDEYYRDINPLAFLTKFQARQAQLEKPVDKDKKSSAQVEDKHKDLKERDYTRQDIEHLKLAGMSSAAEVRSSDEPKYSPHTTTQTVDFTA